MLVPDLDATPNTRLTDFLLTKLDLQGLLFSADADLGEFLLDLSTDRRWQRDLLSLKRHFRRMARLHAVRPRVVMARDRSAASFTARLRAKTLVAGSILFWRKTAANCLRYFR
jgi:hypothetical protein